MYNLFFKKTNRPFEQLTRTHFEGNGIKNILKWIWEVINRYEDGLVKALKKRFFDGGCIILKKSATVFLAFMRYHSYKEVPEYLDTQRRAINLKLNQT